MKQPTKCWKCGGHHYRWDFPMREHKEGSSHKVPRLEDESKAKNQQEKIMEVEGLGPKSSSK